jgi:hypothetical protein
VHLLSNPSRDFPKRNEKSYRRPGNFRTEDLPNACLARCGYTSVLGCIITRGINKITAVSLCMFLYMRADSGAISISDIPKAKNSAGPVPATYIHIDLHKDDISHIFQ